jgi:DNA polymerase-3 subunit alpha
MGTEKTRLLPQDFVHLHNHTQYSLLDGLTKVPALMERVKSLGMEAVAITDHGTMSGSIEFYKEAISSGIKPIIGMETYVASRTHKDKDPSKDKAYYHLILLAMNNVGYQNLMRLSTKANLDGFYYRPRIDRQLLEEHKEGIIVLSGCIGGEVGDMLRQDQYEKAKQTAEWYKSVFGDRYYLEIQDHGHEAHPHKWQEQILVTQKTLQLSEELAIECVITSDAHYLDHADQEAHEILLCVQTGSFLSDEKRMSLKEFDLYITTPEDIVGRWGKSHPEFIKNTRRIADRCNVTLELGKILIPQFPVPKGESERTYLEKLVYRGLAWRYGSQPEEKAQKLSINEAKKCLPDAVRDRAAYELTIIEQMGFCGYFLIIADFINWGKDQGIVFGPGRGSAAGSIIAYSLKITELDPLAYDLLFERFLNPDRISMPDIDIDIQDTRRDEVIQYCVEKYGHDRVANIVTFGRMAARNAVRDVARVLQVPYVEADRLAKMIPPPIQGRHVPLATSLQKDADLKHEYAHNKTAKRVFDLAIQLEGTIRSHGVHAAGVVIAPDDIVKFVPLEMAQKGVVATQYSMGPIEDLGLLKMDFLGLSNLTIIKNALRIIKKVHNVDVDISKLPLEDEKTFQLFQRGDTTGVFQLESSGMKRYLKELKPTVFEDIIAMGALYRPGPLTAGLTDKFIARKNGLEAVTYDHELMEAALKDTYGVMVYQEQFMQIARDMCNFTGGESDTLRKAVGKKKRDLMSKMKGQIIKGATANGVSAKVAEKFWSDLEGFADYAFNKSHAACYALIAYWTAYLKAHYPAEFMAALMTSDYDDTDRLAIEIAECKHMGIVVLQPDVNESFVEFAVVPGKNQIRFSMAAVKNVGTNAVEEILRARKEGVFLSIEDFLSRVNVRIVNRKAIESLIRAGALDRFGSRSTLLHNIDLLLAFAARLQKQATSGQVDLFGAAQDEAHVIPTLALEDAVQHEIHEFLVWERELLGLYLSQHPLEAFELILKELCLPIREAKSERKKGTVKIGGAVEDVREITTKNGQKMAFIRLADMSEEIELVVFPSVYQLTLGLWERDRVVLVKGKLSADNPTGGGQTGEIKLLVEEAREITPAQARAYQATGKKPKKSKTTVKAADDKPDEKAPETLAPRLFVRVPSSEDVERLITIKSVMDKSNGSTEVILVVGKDKLQQAIRLPMRVEPSEVLIEKISLLIGSENVKLS